MDHIAPHVCVVAVISTGQLLIINQPWLNTLWLTFNTERNMASLSNLPLEILKGA